MRPSEAREKSKYTFDECEKKKTKELRQYNIEKFIELISKDIEANHLNIKNERFIILYETKYGEKIGIAYPGQESNEDRKKPFPYDMRPILYTKNAKLLKNQNFYDLYNIIEKIYRKSPEELFPCIVSIIFKMGYLIDVNLKNFEFYDYNNNEYTGNIEYYDYDFDSELVQYLDSQMEVFESKDIEGEKVEISLIAYLMYYYLLFQQEDNKYFYRNHNRVYNQGRTSTALSSILFGGVLQRKIPVSKALQKFIDGRGIGKISLEFLKELTNGIIEYTNFKKEITKLCTEKNIEYKENATVTIKGTIIRGIKISEVKAFLINYKYESYLVELKKRGYENIVLSNRKEDYMKLLNIIRNIEVKSQ